MGHRDEFNIVKELVGKLRQTLKEARNNGYRMPTAELDSALLSLISLISLAARGLCPAALENSFRQVLIRHLSRTVFQLESDLIDRTDFAAHLTRVCHSDHIESLSGQSQFLDELTKLLRSVELKPKESAVFKDPLLLGWAHQVLLAQRKDYTDLRNSKHVDNLAGLTQWFTPSWIADFLIQESLGERGGSSPINNTDSRKKNCDTKEFCDTGARKQTFLDPACGAGHLLVPALRALTGSGEHANGKRLNDLKVTGNLKVASVLSEILEQCLYGLDIDETVLSQAAFSLYLACRDLEPLAPLPIPHLFTFEASLSHLQEEETFGSLLLGLEELPKSIRLKRIDGSVVELNKLPRQFSRIATNPPYLSHRSMPQALTRFLRTHYSGRHYDLYAAFLELTIRLMEPGARTSMICQQSFLTIQRYQQLRRELVERSQILTVAHLGPGAFASRAGEKVSNAIITLERNDKPLAPSSPIKIFKAASLKEAEELGIDNLPQQSLSQQSMKTLTALIPSSPLALWCPEEIALLFKKHAPISDAETGITITNGLFTCNNKKFLKHFKDLDEREVEQHEGRKQFVPYDKGGGKKWYSLTPYYIRWEDGGDSIREYRKKRGQSTSLPGEEFYFKEGVTYSYIGTKGFKARLLSPRSIFDIASSALFSSAVDLNYLLGFLNSALVRYILGVLNPTVNFQIGDLRRLPFKIPSAKQEKRIAELASAAVGIAAELEKSDPQSPAYKQSRLNYFAGTDYAQPQEAYEHMKDRLNDLNTKERAIQQSIDEEIFESYEISRSIREQILTDPWVDSGNKHLVEIPTLAQALLG
jgi:Eco57I restriction endonuclease.